MTPGLCRDGRKELGTPRSPLSPASPEKVCGGGERCRRREGGERGGSGRGCAGAARGARFCNAARAGRPPRLLLSRYHMTEAQGLGVWRNGSGKRLPGPLSHFLSGARGGEETPREGEIRFHNTGLGGAARAGGCPPPPPRTPQPLFTRSFSSRPQLPPRAAPQRREGGAVESSPRPGAPEGRSLRWPREPEKRRPFGVISEHPVH